MHKLESFALSCNSKINKPFIEKCFYPTLEKKYICISKDFIESSQSYDFFDDVVFHIEPFLKKENISILEIGSSKLKRVFYSKNFKNLSRSQNNYILSKSLLYIGNVNFFCHSASALGIKTISPSRNDFIETFKPYWSNEKNCKILISKSKDKPFFLEEEAHKTINDVHPERIAVSILDALGISHDIDFIETIHVGEVYNDNLNVIDIVPGNFSAQEINLDSEICIRMDKNFDLDFLVQCNKMKKFSITTNKVIPKDILSFLKEKIDKISFFIDKKTTKEDLSIIHSCGKNVNLFCKDSKNISKIRLNFIDYTIHEFGKHTKKTLNLKSIKGLKFLSKKNIISNGHMFNSYLSAQKNANISDVEDSDLFFEDLSFFRIYRQKS